jgi:photosystem I subunit 10
MNLLAAVATPRAADWTPTIALIMIICNVLAIAFARFTVQRPKDGPALPLPGLGLSIPALLGATSFGHIIGAGVILGLTNTGALQ